MKKITRNIILTVVLIAFAFSNIACNAGDSNILTPDSGAATDGWSLAMCIQDAGNDPAKAAECFTK